MKFINIHTKSDPVSLEFEEVNNGTWVNVDHIAAVVDRRYRNRVSGECQSFTQVVLSDGSILSTYDQSALEILEEAVVR
jgi:hypothetical protein